MSAKAKVMKSPEGILSYPHLFRPQEEVNPNSVFTGYSVELLLDDLPEDLMEHIDDVINEHFVDPKQRKAAKANIPAIDDKKPHPFVDGQTCVRMRFKLPTKFNRKPIVCDPEGRDLDATDVSAGNLGKVRYTVYAWDMNGRPGVSFGLRAVCKTGEGETLNGSNEDDYDFD